MNRYISALAKIAKGSGKIPNITANQFGRNNCRRYPIAQNQIGHQQEEIGTQRMAPKRGKFVVLGT